jgi:hypothetical protein
MSERGSQPCAKGVAKFGSGIIAHWIAQPLSLLVSEAVAASIERARVQ